MGVTECSVAMEHTDFEGILAGNVRECGAIEAELGSLGEGIYEVTLTVSRLGFANLDRPQEAEPRETKTERLWFSVR